MTSSCAYWSGGATTLEEAQEAKLELVCKKLALREGERVLDVGCGWGSFVIHAATRNGVNAVGITVLQAIERATNGWGVTMGFFRVPYILNGPWYATWLTAFVAGTMLFIYGMWYGIVYRRWGLFGTVAFVAAQVLVALAGSLAVTWTHAWPSVGGFFTGLTALGFTGVIAALAVVLLAGGHATVRRATV